MPKRYILIIALLITCGHDSMAQLTVDSRMTVRDSLTDTHLCSIPESHFGHDLTVSQVGFNGIENVAINGIDASSGFTFSAIDGTKTWTVTATLPDGKKASTKLQFTFLPIVEINSVVEKNVYNTGTVTVLLPDEDIVSPARVKYRGSATNSHVYLKRNYHIKFQDEEGNKMDYKFFDGLRSDNSWLLDAGTLDHMRVRNRVLTDLWLDMASKPYYSDIEPKALNASRGKMVEVFRNGEYQGIYNMCEAMDRKQLKLAKTDEATGEIHGQLWKAGQRTSTTRMATAPQYDNFMETWSGFETQYPDFDDLCPTDYSTLHDAVNFVANSTDEEFATHAHEYLDEPVLRDIAILLQVIFAYDNMGKNTYWATRDRNDGPMITPVVWDLDTSLGQSWHNNEYHPSYLKPDLDVFTYSSNTDVYLKRLIKWDVDSFSTLSGQRYRDLRKGLLSTDSILSRFASCIDMLRHAGAAQREEARWVRCSDLYGRSINFDAELSFITQWLTQRMQWLDEHYYNESPAGDVDGNGLVDISDANILISYLLYKKQLIPEIYTYRLDAKRDMSIDISDMNVVINKILGK